MKADVVIMGILFTTAIFGPLAYLVWMSKAQFRRLNKLIQQQAKQAQLSLEEKEVFNEMALAVDAGKRKLLVVSKDGQSQMIDLTNVLGCQLDSSETEVRLFLNTRGTPLSIVIFDAKRDDPFEKAYLFQIANRWKERISALLKNTYATPLKAA